MTLFRKIVPNSEENTINERYEHLLVWLSVDGGVRQWFFSHTDGQEVEDFDSFNVEGLSDIRSIPTEDRESFKCVTKWMDSDTFDYVRSIKASNRVYKVLRDGSKIPVAVKSGKVKRDNQVKNFEMSLEFMYKEKAVLNV